MGSETQQLETEVSPRQPPSPRLRDTAPLNMVTERVGMVNERVDMVTGHVDMVNDMVTEPVDMLEGPVDMANDLVGMVTVPRDVTREEDHQELEVRGLHNTHIHQVHVFSSLLNFFHHLIVNQTPISNFFIISGNL